MLSAHLSLQHSPPLGIDIILLNEVDSVLSSTLACEVCEKRFSSQTARDRRLQNARDAVNVALTDVIVRERLTQAKTDLFCKRAREELEQELLRTPILSPPLEPNLTALSIDKANLFLFIENVLGYYLGNTIEELATVNTKIEKEEYLGRLSQYRKNAVAFIARLENPSAFIDEDEVEQRAMMLKLAYIPLSYKKRLRQRLVVKSDIDEAHESLKDSNEVGSDISMQDIAVSLSVFAT
ncbi:MAG: hypothetical protein M1813_005909 [Trichoglossum hirsutum]|nr:MAG: hypothetical protein M1813_005909 [Trichoglossum hirsutum]